VQKDKIEDREREKLGMEGEEEVQTGEGKK
jgi:hypothetical protein